MKIFLTSKHDRNNQKCDDANNQHPAFMPEVAVGALLPWASNSLNERLLVAHYFLEYESRQFLVHRWAAEMK